MSYKKILFIINPSAGKFKSSFVKRLQKGFSKVNNIRFSFTFTKKKGDAFSIVKSLKKSDYHVIAACGGDGTINEVINGIYNNNALRSVKLAVIPLGTANVLAYELGLKNISRSLKAIINNNCEKIYVGKINKSNVYFYFTLMAGIGLDANAVKKVSKKVKKRLGKIAYLFSLAKIVFRRNSLKRFKVSDGKYEINCYSAIISNAKNYGGNFRLARQIDLYEPKLEATILLENSFTSILKFILGVVFAKFHNGKDIYKLVSNKFEAYGKAKIPIQLDGDAMLSTPVSIESERRSIKVFC
jgi:YegS/Rv2252/BmrU family lipid kinase